MYVKTASDNSILQFKNVFSLVLAFVAFSWYQQPAAQSIKIVPISEIPVFPAPILQQAHCHTQSQNVHQVKPFGGR